MPFFTKGLVTKTLTRCEHLIDDLAIALFPFSEEDKDDFVRNFKDRKGDRGEVVEKIDADIENIFKKLLDTDSLQNGFSTFCKKFDIPPSQSTDYPEVILHIASHAKDIDKKLREQGI